MQSRASFRQTVISTSRVHACIYPEHLGYKATHRGIMQKRTSCIQTTQGFTMIEVLVAILILSFGMLGIVGMQAFALQSNRDAKLYSEATGLARELAEMMRGNNLIAIKTDAAENPYLTTSLAANESPEDCLAVGSSCTNNKDVAAAQMTEWRSRVSTTLPGARVAICFDSAPSDDKGLPQWSCTAGAADVDEIIVLKLGWTQRSTDSSASDANASIKASNNNSRPQIILPVTGGNPFPLDPP